MLCVEQLPDDPALLKQMLVEHYANRDAEIQAAVDEAVQAAVAKAIKETTALFCGGFTVRGTNASIRGNSCCLA